MQDCRIPRKTTEYRIHIWLLTNKAHIHLHQWAIRTGDPERNPQADKVPVLSDSDMVQLFYDENCEVAASTLRKRLHDARKAASEMEADGNVLIERDAIDHKMGIKGWRILEVRPLEALPRSSL